MQPFPHRIALTLVALTMPLSALSLPAADPPTATGTPSAPSFAELVPTAEKSPVLWRYTLEKPADGWHKPGFDDSAWRQGPAPFGREEAPFARKPRTVWTGADIWLRREIVLPEEKLGEPMLWLYHDEDVEVFINGVPAATIPGYNVGYEEFPLRAEALATLRPGKNVLAASCRQTVGGQYFDLGLADAVPGRWSADRAARWYEGQPWPCGFNYIPATAINTTEMWQAETFDPVTIDKELALAESVGFNCVRVFVQFLVWEKDPEGLKQRMDRFLEIASRHKLRTIWVLFDDCAFGTMAEPFLGKQPELKPGEYANGWTPSPGPSRVRDRGAWPALESYVRDLVSRFRDDPRVLLWDLYNEPSNGPGNISLPLLQAVFVWARDAKPSQPLSAGVWGGTRETTSASLALSDVITFHCYNPAPAVEDRIKELIARKRPVICTEWLNRNTGSLVESCLPVFAGHSVGCLHWGLVNGKTQTQFAWGSKAGAPQPKVWQHDIFRPDHTPYDSREIEHFKQSLGLEATRRRAADGRLTAEKAWEWYRNVPWLVGCNFVPSTAANDVEMWQAESFDPATLDRELGLAEGLGFNTVRVFLNYAVWEADAEGLRGRIDRFLALADKHRIRVMPILFDDCFKPEPAVGKQPAPVPGVHNSQWVQSPGVRRRGDRAAWPMLEKYVKDVVGRFADDRRVVIWDLYNEPTASRPLVECTFAWAREVHPSQPLTSCWLGEPYSDLTNLHHYGPLPGLQAEVAAKKKALGRPVILTEYLARGAGSRFETHLPYLKQEKIGCWNWGLVAGRTQTYLPWGSPKGAPEPKLWHHDLFRADGTPYSAEEAELIRRLTSDRPMPGP